MWCCGFSGQPTGARPTDIELPVGYRTSVLVSFRKCGIQSAPMECHGRTLYTSPPPMTCTPYGRGCTRDDCVWTEREGRRRWRLRGAYVPLVTSSTRSTMKPRTPRTHTGENSRRRGPPMHSRKARFRRQNRPRFTLNRVRSAPSRGGPSCVGTHVGWCSVAMATTSPLLLAVRSRTTHRGDHTPHFVFGSHIRVGVTTVAAAAGCVPLTCAVPPDDARVCVL